MIYCSVTFTSFTSEYVLENFALMKSATCLSLYLSFHSYASVKVVLKNEGYDAFKQEIYGESIIIERRITESSSSLAL